MIFSKKMAGPGWPASVGVSVIERRPCAICGDKGWVCGIHPLRPAVMFSDRADACKCGGAAEPCAYCNMPSRDKEPDISRGALPSDFNKITWKQ